MSVAALLLKRKQELAEKNKREGNVYRETFSQQEGVIALPSGVLYRITEEGTGIYPTLESKVRCHYHGTNVYGEVFDSSVERGKPADFQINKLIKGWQEVMPLLKVGSKAEIVIPAESAYGEEQISKEIGPNSTLVFQVELIDILIL
ncbi:FKBP-type peptidyl-prolyl cis-trans isomerase [Flavobacterium sp. CBA20B-1]|uniref:FKBP-type peptidyl-prolyl cis-trans isomerase n=1 Tax=unclassified Flavobacterium TaxID=196869 RepID=UPI002225A3B4|nr:MULTISPECIES: FKBP-type peptidyl-prolyl cis-trans isomerase [unclassified Flavobacterium]WCM42964.1 FKBP-type peptidyl-prolyl cis-trans isomerase [Flavobacterium sp. CBA20B-1]